MFDEKLLSVQDVCDSWAVTPAFIKNHAAHEGRSAKCLPELPAVVVGGRLMFEPLAVRCFFRAYRVHLQLVRKRSKHAA
jgi:hypothetical protein